MRLSCSCPRFFSLCSHSTPPAGDLGWLGHQGSTLIYWASYYRTITHWYFPPETSISFYPWLYSLSSAFLHCFALSRIMMFKKMIKKEEIKETPVGTNQEDCISSPLTFVYWKESNKALWVSRRRLFSYFILWPLCMQRHFFGTSYDLWETD